MQVIPYRAGDRVLELSRSCAGRGQCPVLTLDGTTLRSCGCPRHPKPGRPFSLEHQSWLRRVDVKQARATSGPNGMYSSPEPGLRSWFPPAFGACLIDSSFPGIDVPDCCWLIPDSPSKRRCWGRTYRQFTFPWLNVSAYTAVTLFAKAQRNRDKKASSPAERLEMRKQAGKTSVRPSSCWWMKTDPPMVRLSSCVTVCRGKFGRNYRKGPRVGKIIVGKR